MEAVMEQFIPSDKSRKFSRLLRNISIAIAVLGIVNLGFSIILAIIFEVAALAIFIIGYTSYVDYEYEVVNETITVTKIYNCSRRKIVATFNKEEVKNVSLTRQSDMNRKGAVICYNSRLDGLTVYTFELQNNKILQLALNEELEKMVKIYYRQALTRY